MRVLFVGLPGVGKTSIAGRISDWNLFGVVNIGDLMKQKRFNPTTEQGSLKNNIEEKRLSVSRYIDREYDSNLIITGHGVVWLDSNNYIFGSSLEDVNVMKISLLVIIEAMPEIIYQRRMNDILIRRDRIIENKEIIDKNQQAQRRHYTEICNNIAIPYLVFDNSGKIDNSVKILEKIEECDRQFLWNADS